MFRKITWFGGFTFDCLVLVAAMHIVYTTYVPSVPPAVQVMPEPTPPTVDWSGAWELWRGNTGEPEWFQNEQPIWEPQPLWQPQIEQKLDRSRLIEPLFRVPKEPELKRLPPVKPEPRTPPRYSGPVYYA